MRKNNARVIMVVMLSIVLFCGCGSVESESVKQGIDTNITVSNKESVEEKGMVASLDPVDIVFRRDDRSIKMTGDEKHTGTVYFYYDEALLPENVNNYEKINADIEAKKDAFFAERENWYGYNLTEIADTNCVDEIFSYATVKSIYLDERYYSVNVEESACYAGTDISNFIGYTYDLETGEEIDITDVLGIDEEVLSSIMYDRIAMFNINPSMDGYPDTADFLEDEEWGGFNYCIAQEGKIYALYNKNTIAGGYQGSGAYYVTDLKDKSSNIRFTNMYEIEGGSWHSFTADIEADIAHKMNISMRQDIDFREKAPVKENEKWYVPVEFCVFNKEQWKTDNIASAKVEMDNPSNMLIIQAAYDNIVDFDSCITEEDHDKLADIVDEYCTAKESGNMDLIGQITQDTMQMEDLYLIEENSKFMDSISERKLYVLKGYRSGSYVVLVTYYENYSGLKKGIPGLDYLYVCKNNEDEFYINFAELDEVEQDYIDAMAGQDSLDFEIRSEIGDVWDDFGVIEFNQLLNADKELSDAFGEIDASVRKRVEARMNNEQLLKVVSAHATSTLKTVSKDNSDYVAKNLIDGDLKTAWIEGVEGTGVGEEITLKLDEEYELSKLVIYNGFLKTKRRYTINGKVVQIRISCNKSYTSAKVNVMQPGEEEEGFSYDGFNPTEIDMDGCVTDTIKLVIESAEAGSLYDDTAISEIEVYAKSKNISRDANAQITKKEAKKIAESLGDNIYALEYHDYDFDGRNETFVVTGVEDDYGSYLLDAVWFISGDGKTKEMLSDFKRSKDLKMYKNDKGYYLEYADAGQGFYYADCGGGGSGWITFVFGVRDGEPYELDISMKTEGFYQDKPGEFYTLTDDFTDGHKYYITELDYDRGTQQFSVGKVTDREWM